MGHRVAVWQRTSLNGHSFRSLQCPCGFMAECTPDTGPPYPKTTTKLFLVGCHSGVGWGQMGGFGCSLGSRPGHVHAQSPRILPLGPPSLARPAEGLKKRMFGGGCLTTHMAHGVGLELMECFQKRYTDCVLSVAQKRFWPTRWKNARKYCIPLPPSSPFLPTPTSTQPHPTRYRIESQQWRWWWWWQGGLIL